eukprot:Skav213324  [mRNA]  locus=scaffold3340:51732:52553:- [translate_table: standard]
MRFTLAQVLCCFCAHGFWEQGPLYKDVNQNEIELFTTARKVLVIPLCFVTFFHFVELMSAKPRKKALIISRVSMLEFSIKITYYTLLSEGYGLAFWNQRCIDYRPIYVTRWVGWSFAIPTLLLMNFYPIMDDQSLETVLVRIFPQQAATWAYCWACCLGCIVIDPWMGWILNTLGCVAYIVVILDEIVLVSELILTCTQPVLKGYSIIIKESIFVIYTCVYLCGLWGFASSYACQRFYTVSDISLKATMSFLLFFFWTVDNLSKSDSASDKTL